MTLPEVARSLRLRARDDKNTALLDLPHRPEIPRKELADRLAKSTPVKAVSLARLPCERLLKETPDQTASAVVAGRVGMEQSGTGDGLKREAVQRACPGSSLFAGISSMA